MIQLSKHFVSPVALAMRLVQAGQRISGKRGPERDVEKAVSMCYWDICYWDIQGDHLDE